MYSRAAYRPVLALRNQTAQRFTIMKIWKALRRFMSSHSRKRSVLKFKEPTNLLNSRQSTTSTSNKAYYTANNSSKAKRPFKRKSLLRIQESSDPTTSILTLIFQPYLIHSKDIESPRNAEPKCATGWSKFVQASSAPKEHGTYPSQSSTSTWQPATTMASFLRTETSTRVELHQCTWLLRWKIPTHYIPE